MVRQTAASAEAVASAAEVTPGAEAPARTHTLTVGSVAYLDRIGAVARAILSVLNIGHVPDVTILPGLPFRNGRGSSGGRDAATFSVVPPTESVSLRKDKIRDAKNKVIRTATVKASNGTPETHRIGAAWTIILSVLKYSAHEDRERNETRSTADMVHDVIRAMVFAVAEYAPTVTGKVGAVATLAETLKKASKEGYAVEPVVTFSKNPDGTPKMTAAGKQAKRTDWSAMRFSKPLSELVARHILDASLPADPPADITLDFLTFLSGKDRSSGSTKYQTITIKVGAQDVPLRITTVDVQRMIKAVTADGADPVDTFGGITIHLTKAQVDAAMAHKSRTSKPDAPVKGALAGSVNRTPRLRKPADATV